MSNPNEEENEGEEEKQGDPEQGTRFLNASANPFVPDEAQLQQQVEAYERFKRFYRRLSPRRPHAEFLYGYR